MDLVEFYQNKSIEIDLDFDENFYQNEYPDLLGYYLPWAKDNGFSEKQRLFHHYYLYGKKEGRFANLKEKYFILQNKIYIKVQNGLANRIRNLNSFYNFATTYDKKLFVCWEEGPGWGREHFLDLFENIENINFISNEEYEKHSSQYENIDKLIDKVPPIYYVLKAPGGRICDLIQNKSFCYNGESALEYFLPCDIKTNNTFFDKLVVKKNISYKIDKIVSLFDESTIGVHIRRGDALNSPWKAFFNLSNDDFFIKEMIKEIDKNPKANFYLSTDCEQTQKKFLEMFGDKIIVLEKDFAESIDMHNPKFGQESALIDLFCLSNTNKIIGTYWSSFSTLAANLKRKPISLSSNHVESYKAYNISAKNSKKETTSIVCSVKNRLNPLLLSITSWLMIPQIDNIIIVDYSSDEAVEPKVKNLSDKISVIRIENEKFFNISKAYNIGFKAAPDGLILKMDADYVMSPYLNFFKIYSLKEKEFITGSWEDLNVDNQKGFLRHLSGFLFIRKNDFLSIGGYDERFKDYGFDDCDLCDRLEKKGMRHKYLNHKYISVFHIPHDNYHRTTNYKNKDLNNSSEKNQIISLTKNKTDCE